jgi:DNA modification methylase
MRRPIANNSRPGQTIYDPFLGSGTSLIAAEMTGRMCYGLELDPAYVDVVVRRWQLFTERSARHDASGQLFGERAQTENPDHSGAAHGEKSLCRR